jgi:predicted glycosyltransferase
MRASTDGLFVYCQSAFGVGHFVRCLRLIQAVQQACAGLPVSLFHGGRSAGFLNLPVTVDAIELEPLVFADFNSGLSTPTGADASELLLWRSRCLTENLVRLRPRAVLLEHFPFGRWGFAPEIFPLIECCRSLKPRPLLWSSVRDIPVLSGADYRRMLEVVPYFDRIFVHSDPAILCLDLGFPLPERVTARIEYTGYVTPKSGEHLSRGAYVLVHAGGGRDGKSFWSSLDSLRAAISHVEFRACGKDPCELAGLRSVERLLRSAWRSISMAGYNTVAEWLAFRTPTIFVPRHAEPEQLKRLHRLQECIGGPMTISDPAPDALRKAWDILKDDEPFRADVWIDGQEHFAQTVQHYLR